MILNQVKATNYPLVSIIIPTLNSASVLVACLSSINTQSYSKDKIEIIISDGGSTDNTIKIAQKYGCTLVSNPLKTGESGKAVGLKKAQGKYLIFIDSDNILPTPNWLKLMIEPLEKNSQIIGSEPWEYTYRSDGGFIERYSALTGVNDPYSLTAGNYDRLGYLHSSWTGLNIPITDTPNYQIATLKYNSLIPTIGANGTIFRRDFLKRYFHGEYFFDIDMITSSLDINHSLVLFAKVKIGILHTFCESSIKKFYKKQVRRATDLYIYKPYRSYLLVSNNFWPTLKFILYTILIFPMLFDTTKGLILKPDLAWLFHPLACIITLYAYSLGTIKHKLGLLKPINRQLWQQ